MKRAPYAPATAAPSASDSVAASEAAREADLNAGAAKLAAHSIFTVNQMAKEERVCAAGRALMLANMAETHRRAAEAISKIAVMATLKAAEGSK